MSYREYILLCINNNLALITTDYKPHKIGSITHIDDDPTLKIRIIREATKEEFIQFGNKIVELGIGIFNNPPSNYFYEVHID